MIGAELNAAIEDEWPAPVPHWHQFRSWMQRRNQPARDTGAPVAVPTEAPEAAVSPS
jgi:membrane protein